MDHPSMQQKMKHANTIEDPIGTQKCDKLH